MKYHISMRKPASLKALQQIKDITPDDAEKIRTIWRTIGNRQSAREQINAVLRTHGVEYLGQHKRTGEHVYYCNAGDTYAATVLFSGLRMHVGCWGDLVEKRLIAEPVQM
jgi:hypothetical protein